MRTPKQTAFVLLILLVLAIRVSAQDFQNAAEAAARWVTSAAIARDGG